MNGWQKKRSVMLRYNATAKMYDSRYADEQEAKYKVALQNLECSRFGSVLDVGCGTGLLFGHIDKNTRLIVGVDLSKKCLLEARNRSRSNPQVHLVHADADYLPLKEGVFDQVFAMTLLQNMPKPAQSSREMAKVSKDEAFFIVTGLKKIFPKQVFMKLLHDGGLKMEVMMDREDLKCFVAKCSRLHR